MKFVRGRHVVPVEAVLNGSRIRFSALTATVISIGTASPTWSRYIDSNFPNGFVTVVSPSPTTILCQVEKAFLMVFARATQRCQTANQLTDQGIMLDRISSYRCRQRD